MNKFLSAGVLSLLAFIAVARQNDPRTMHETARTFMRQGDYPNAILVLNRAVVLEPGNLEMKKDLAFAYYLQKDYVKAMETAKPLADHKDADVQSFQILGMVYKAVEDKKEAERMYRAGIRKFPASGVLYNEFGELQWSKKEFTDAARQWEKGIEMDPNYSGNYYNAAKYYYFSADKVWGIIYGEIFVNLESYSKRTPEIKNILFDGYKKLFSETDILRQQNPKNEFTRAFLETMQKHASVVSNGVTPESLSALRTRFILEWFDRQAPRFPFRLFEYQRQLLKGGMFEAYNQWIFGAAKNLSDFENWTITHTEEYNQFNGFQKNRVFKLPQGQYYQATASR